MAFQKISPAIQLPAFTLTGKALAQVIDWIKLLLVAIDVRDRDISAWINGASAWTWTAVSSFSNSWVNFGSPAFDAAYCKDSLGIVHLRGTVKGGSSNTTAFTLPDGFRPSARVSFAVYASGPEAARCHVAADGSVNLQTASGTTTNGVGLDGVHFYAG